MIDPDGTNRASTEFAVEALAKTPAAIVNLRKMIENNDYIDEAIERIALVLSDEILNYRNYKEGGQFNERFRKRRK
jgi:hypothetical protein